MFQQRKQQRSAAPVSNALAYYAAASQNYGTPMRQAPPNAQYFDPTGPAQIGANQISAGYYGGANTRHQGVVPPASRAATPMNPQLLAQYQNQGVSAQQEQQMRMAALSPQELSSMQQRSQNSASPENQIQQLQRTSAVYGAQRNAASAAQNAYQQPGPMTAANRQAIGRDPFFEQQYLWNRLPSNQPPAMAGGMGGSWQGTNDRDMYGNRL